MQRDQVRWLDTLEPYVPVALWQERQRLLAAIEQRRCTLLDHHHRGQSIHLAWAGSNVSAGRQLRVRSAAGHMTPDLACIREHLARTDPAESRDPDHRNAGTMARGPQGGGNCEPIHAHPASCTNRSLMDAASASGALGAAVLWIAQAHPRAAEEIPAGPSGGCRWRWTGTPTSMSLGTIGLPTLLSRKTVLRAQQLAQDVQRYGLRKVMVKPRRGRARFV